jgi:hypothetical protein
MNKLALYCRAGFEKEIAGEITEKAAELGVFGFANLKENSGYVIFECYQAGDADRLARELKFNQLIFARQMIVVGDLLQNLPERTNKICKLMLPFACPDFPNQPCFFKRLRNGTVNFRQKVRSSFASFVSGVSTKISLLLRGFNA